MEKIQQPAPTWRVTLLPSILAGAAATVTIYATAKTLVVLGHRDSGLLNIWPVALGVFLLSGCLIGVKLSSAHRQFRTGIWSARFAGFVAANGGIAAGVIIWLMVEELILKRFGVYPIYEAHNLFPFEIIFLWKLAAVPLLLGMCLGFAFSMRFGHRDLQ